MRHKRYYSATEISNFLYCEEQYRLKKLEEKGLLQVEDEENVFIDSRLEDGRNYHQQYAQRFRPAKKNASNNGCTIGCAVVLVLLFASPFIVFLLQFILELLARGT